MSLLRRFTSVNRLSIAAIVLLAPPLVQCGSDGSSTFGKNPTTDDGGSSGSSSGSFVNTCEGPCETSDKDAAPTATCGDRELLTTEGCDDGNQIPGDGCSATCTVEEGWVCPTPGLPCEAAKCGDGILAGVEECEHPDGGTATGCTADCKIQDGFDCDPNTFECSIVKCGDGKVQRGESCEDGNELPFDGCYECQKEPSCVDGVCQSACGDGQRFTGEECDDGNTRSGDGCSATCKREPGFTCTDVVGTPPETILLPLIVRDFIGQGNTKSGSTAHPDFNQKKAYSVTGIVLPELDENGRMVPNCPNDDCTKNVAYNKPDDDHTNFTTAENFAKWYTDNDANIKSVFTLELKRKDGAYVWDSADPTQNPHAADSFLDPVGTGGWVAQGKEERVCSPLRNVSWTTETHFWFEYQGGEQFSFSGDDDTWVFVNRRLVLDLGGLHGKLTGTVTFDPENGNAAYNSAHGTGSIELGLTKGGVYELVMFQAERNQCNSNFKITLKDFNKPKSSCVSTCGDGIVASNEVCDDGKNDGSYGGCMPGCKARAPRCGDGIVQADQGEECDDANTNNSDECTNGCRTVTVK